MNFSDDYNMNIEETLHAQGPPERRSLLVMGVEIAMCIFLKAMTKAFLGVSGDAYCITGNSILLSQYMSLSDDIILMVMKTTGGDVGGLQYELNCVLEWPTIN